ncbi:hypothetical protein [Vibrio parahaemolyticus]
MDNDEIVNHAIAQDKQMLQYASERLQKIVQNLI